MIYNLSGFKMIKSSRFRWEERVVRVGKGRYVYRILGGIHERKRPDGKERV